MIIIAAANDREKLPPRRRCRLCPAGGGRVRGGGVGQGSAGSGSGRSGHSRDVCSMLRSGFSLTREKTKNNSPRTEFISSSQLHLLWCFFL